MTDYDMETCAMHGYCHVSVCVDQPHSRWNGSYRHMPKLHGGGKDAHGPRGVQRMMRTIRAAEAIDRNSRTPHDRTKAHRLGRCDTQACELSGDWDGSLIPPYDI